MRFLRFLSYHNAVPIAISLMLLGAGGVFAATDPQAVLSSQKQVLSVDNTYIANKDLSTYTPKVTITGVTEDAATYYVAYTLSSIDIKDYVWQDVMKDETMTVSKAALGKYEDLGLYVTGQLRNVIDNELSYLHQVQNKEQKNITQKTVATTYGGLIGKFLDNSTETLPGYTPVVTPPPEPPQPAAVAAAPDRGGNFTPNTTPEPQAPPTPTASTTPTNTALLSFQILGNNPVVLTVGDSYIDLGAVLIDPTNPNLGYHTFVDGAEETTPFIDTHIPGVHTIEYRATDQAGNVASATRTITVTAKPGILMASTTSTVVPGTTTNTATPSTTTSLDTGTSSIPTNTKTPSTTISTDTGTTSTTTP